MYVILQFFVVISLATCVASSITCLGENGEHVDMFILYKLPRITWYHETVPQYVKEGHGYAYMSPSTGYKFILSNQSIADDNSAAGRTLDQVYRAYDTTKNYTKKFGVKYYDGPDDIAHVFYNDENPNGEVYFDCGHTKGGLAFDKQSGFWLIHSVPKYLTPASDGYVYPHNGCKYGQMFMCVSFKSSAFNDIGLQLRFNEPHVHDANLPRDWVDKYEHIEKLINGEMMSGNPTNNLKSLKSLNGKKLYHFAKNGKFGKDLYHDFVAPSLKSDLYTETWQYGKVIGPSCSGDYIVNDIDKLSVDTPFMSFPFDCHDDHSKYVVTMAPSNGGYVCIGDINREPSQFRRGGGTLCHENSDLWKSFYSMIKTSNSCNRVKFFTKHGKLLSAKYLKVRGNV